MVNKLRGDSMTEQVIQQLKKSKKVLMDDYKLEFMSLSNFNAKNQHQKFNQFNRKNTGILHVEKEGYELTDHPSSDDRDNNLRNQVSRLIEEKNYMQQKFEQELQLKDR